MVSADNTCPQCSPILFPSAVRFVQGYSTCPGKRNSLDTVPEALVVSDDYTVCKVSIPLMKVCYPWPAWRSNLVVRVLPLLRYLQVMQPRKRRMLQMG